MPLALQKWRHPQKNFIFHCFISQLNVGASARISFWIITKILSSRYQKELFSKYGSLHLWTSLWGENSSLPASWWLVSMSTKWPFHITKPNTFGPTTKKVPRLLFSSHYVEKKRKASSSMAPPGGWYNTWPQQLAAATTAHHDGRKIERDTSTLFISQQALLVKNVQHSKARMRTMLKKQTVYFLKLWDLS